MDMNAWILAAGVAAFPLSGAVPAPGQEIDGQIVDGDRGRSLDASRPELGGTLIHKGGGMPDFASQILYVPEVDLVAIWTCNNLTRRWRRALNKGLLEIAEGRPYGIEEALRDISKGAPQE